MNYQNYQEERITVTSLQKSKTKNSVIFSWTFGLYGYQQETQINISFGAKARIGISISFFLESNIKNNIW